MTARWSDPHRLPGPPTGYVRAVNPPRRPDERARVPSHNALTSGREHLARCACRCWIHLAGSPTTDEGHRRVRRRSLRRGRCCCAFLAVRRVSKLRIRRHPHPRRVDPPIAGAWRCDRRRFGNQRIGDSGGRTAGPPVARPSSSVPGASSSWSSRRSSQRGSCWPGLAASGPQSEHPRVRPCRRCRLPGLPTGGPRLQALMSLRE